MIRSCLLILAGGFAAQQCRVPLSPDLCKLLFVAVAVMCLRNRTRPGAWLLLGFVLFMQAGQSIITARLDPRFAGDSILTQVRIVDFPKSTGASVVMIVEPLDDHRLPPRSRVSWFEPPLLPSIGDIWEFELRLRRPRGNSNPGVFDIETWMFRQDIHAAGYVVGSDRNRLLDAGKEPAVDRFRREFIALAKEAAPNAETAAVLAAIGVGSRHLITPQQWRRYAQTGTSHLMAISGLHIGLAAAVAFAVVAGLSGLLRLPGNHLQRAIVAGVLLAIAYAAVSGLAVPARRAAIMLTVAALCFLRRRQVDPASTVAFAALCVYLFDPVSAMTPGFSLSFGAVALLLWLARRHWRMPDRNRWLARARRSLQQLMTMQGMLLIGLLPLTVLHFQRVAFLAPAANLLTVPIFSFVTVPTVLASMILSRFSTVLSLAILRVAAASADIADTMMRQFESLSFAEVSIAAIGPGEWCFLFLPALWVVLPKRWPGRWIAILGIVAIVLHKPAGPDNGCLNAYFLDVGQGLAVVVQTSNHVLLFDTGASYRNGGSAAERVVLPFLRSRGIGRIDWLVVSHGDDDHAGGVGALADHFRGDGLGTVLVGEQLPDVLVDTVDCYAGQRWSADGVEFAVLHPESGSRHEGNDSSCVLAVRAGRHTVLLTGDIEAAAERELIQRGLLPVADVVLIPHHGSLTSSSRPFVNSTRPGLAIASTGYRNRWNLPQQRVTDRWQAAGAEVLDTGTSGAISLSLCRVGGIRWLQRERQQQRRFWHDGQD